MKQRSPWVVFIILLTGVFVTLEASAFLTPALPYISKYFGLPTKYAGLITIFYYITAIALAPLFGRLGDQIGRKNIVLAGLLIFSFSEFLGVMSPKLTIFFLARFIQGIGYACIFPNVFAYISELFKVEKRGRAIGLFMLFTYIATGTGGIISGLLIQSFSWRTIFVTSGTLAFIGFILVTLFVPKVVFEVKKRQLNYLGVFIMMITIAVIVTLPISISTFGLVSLITAGQIALAIVLVAFLLLYERNVDSPMIDLSVLKKRGNAISCVLITVQNITMLSIIYSLTFYASGHAGWTPIEVGLIATVNFSVAAILSPFIGRYLDKYRPVHLVILGLFSSLIGIGIFYFIDFKSSLLYMLLVTVFIGTTSGTLNAALMKIIITETPDSIKGVGTGTFALFKDLGLPLGSTFGTTLYGTAVASGVEKNIGNVLATNNINTSFANDILAVQGGAKVSAGLQNALNQSGVTLDNLIAQANNLGVKSAIETVGIVNFVLVIFILLLSTLLLKKQTVEYVNQEDETKPILS